MVELTVLKGMTWNHPRGLDSVVACNALLEERFGVTVEWTARSLLDFGDQHVREFAPGHDLMVIDHPHVPDGVVDGALMAMDELLSSEQLEELALESAGPSHESYRFRGQIWALAIDAATQVSVYRPDLTDGVPPFWSDVLSDARKGRVLWPHKPVDAFSTFATVSAQWGSPLGSGESFLNEDVTREVMEFLLAFASLVPEFCQSSNPFEVAEMLVSSDDYAYAAPLYGYTNYSRHGFRSRVLAYDEVPSFDGLASGAQLGGAGIAVSAHSSQPEKAAAVAAYLSSAEAQNGPYTEMHGQPGNLRAWLSPAMNSLTTGFFRNTLRTLERSWVRPRVVGWPDFQFAVSQVIHHALVNKEFTASDWSKMAEQVDRLREKAEG
jgi:multiple sugar transport system substrate-binding protein